MLGGIVLLHIDISFDGSVIYVSKIKSSAVLQSKIWILKPTQEWIQNIRNLFYCIESDIYSNYMGKPKRFTNIYSCFQGSEWEFNRNFPSSVILWCDF